jgi:hypothetical protein
MATDRVSIDSAGLYQATGFSFLSVVQGTSVDVSIMHDYH